MVLIDDTMFIALAQYLPETSSTTIKFNVRDRTYKKLLRNCSAFRILSA